MTQPGRDDTAERTAERLSWGPDDFEVEPAEEPDQADEPAGTDEG